MIPGRKSAGVTKVNSLLGPEITLGVCRKTPPEDMPEGLLNGVGMIPDHPRLGARNGSALSVCNNGNVQQHLGRQSPIAGVPFD